jgi:hypothetical protein
MGIWQLVLVAEKLWESLTIGWEMRKMSRGRDLSDMAYPRLFG